MRKVLILMRVLTMQLLMFLIIGAVVMLPIRQANGQEGSQVTTNARINLRAGPSTTYPIIGAVNFDQTLTLHGRAPNSSLWVLVQTLEGQRGWLAREYTSANSAQLGALPVLSEAEIAELAASLIPPTPVPAPAVVEQAGPTEDDTVSAAGVVSAPTDIVSGVSGNARAIFRHGQTLGNRPNVFSKIGDSITANPHFLYPIGWGSYDLGSYSQYQAVINHFSATTARTSNSFANASLAAQGGWTTTIVLDPAHADPVNCPINTSPLVCEYQVVRPALALIMLGTNDIIFVAPEQFRANLAMIVETSANMGVIPVLSTVPHRFQDPQEVAQYNQIIVETARFYDIPLWDYHSAMNGLLEDGSGLSEDGVHPSFPPGAHAEDFAAAARFTPQNLRYGYTMRNLTALQVLDTLWRRVLR